MVAINRQTSYNPVSSDKTTESNEVCRWLKHGHNLGSTLPGGPNSASDQTVRAVHSCKSLFDVRCSFKCRCASFAGLEETTGKLRLT